MNGIVLQAPREHLGLSKALFIQCCVQLSLDRPVPVGCGLPVSDNVDPEQDHHDVLAKVDGQEEGTRQ